VVRARRQRRGAALFAGWIGGEEPNLLRYVFRTPKPASFSTTGPIARDGFLRSSVPIPPADSDDRAMQAMVDDLRAASSDFERLWTCHAVLSREGGRRMFNHPQDGVLHYEQITLIPPHILGHKVVTLIPFLG
jgi:hypothetical protein